MKRNPDGVNTSFPHTPRWGATKILPLCLQSVVAQGELVKDSFLRDLKPENSYTALIFDSSEESNEKTNSFLLHKEEFKGKRPSLMFEEMKVQLEIFGRHLSNDDFSLKKVNGCLDFLKNHLYMVVEGSAANSPLSDPGPQKKAIPLRDKASISPAQIHTPSERSIAILNSQFPFDVRVGFAKTSAAFSFFPIRDTLAFLSNIEEQTFKWSLQLFSDVSSDAPKSLQRSEHWKDQANTAYETFMELFGSTVGVRLIVSCNAQIFYSHSPLVDTSDPSSMVAKNIGMHYENWAPTSRPGFLYGGNEAWEPENPPEVAEDSQETETPPVVSRVPFFGPTQIRPHNLVVHHRVDEPLQLKSKYDRGDCFAFPGQDYTRTNAGYLQQVQGWGESPQIAIQMFTGRLSLRFNPEGTTTINGKELENVLSRVMNHLWLSFEHQDSIKLCVPLASNWTRRDERDAEGLPVLTALWGVPVSSELVIGPQRSFSFGVSVEPRSLHKASPVIRKHYETLDLNELVNSINAQAKDMLCTWETTAIAKFATDPHNG